MSPTDRDVPEPLAGALARQAQREKAYFRFALTGIVETRADGMIAAANPAAASILGGSPRALLGNTLVAALALDAAQSARFARHLALLSEQGISRTEIERVSPAGGTTMLEWTSVDLGEGTTLHNFDDVTERRRAIEATEAARRAAEDAALAKSRFAANVSHEIRTPLSAILGYAELALRARPQPPLDRHLGRIREAAELLLALLNNVLDFSRLESGKLEAERIAFSLDALLERVRAVAAQSADAKGLALVFEVAPDVPRELVGDPTRLAQVLLNLLGNAVKFTARGAVRLRVERIGAAGQAHRLRFSVADTGKGVSREEAARLFEPFTQADASTTRLHGGTGLGLAIAKGLVEAMGGTIALESEPGRGTTVRFELPLAVAAAADRTPAERNASLAPSFAGRTVLLAEDNPLGREWLAALLGSAGMRVVEAHDGEEAVEKALSAPAPDLVLMDMQMPRLDGLGAAAALRARGCGIPIVALTANASEADRERCLAAGMNAFLPKPFGAGALWAVLAEFLPQTSARALVSAEACAERFMNDPALHRRFVGKFLAEHARNADALRACFAAGSHDEAARLAHGMRGAAALIGADRVSAAAGEIERAACSGDNGDKREAEALCDALGRQMAELEAWLASERQVGDPD